VKVAVNSVPVAPLPGPLVLVGTFEAPLLGFAEPTVGSVAAAPAVPAGPGTAVAPATAAPVLVPTLALPLLPHPDTKAASSQAMNQLQVVAAPRLQLLIFVSCR
jgi:hypothetical protein